MSNENVFLKKSVHSKISKAIYVVNGTYFWEGESTNLVLGGGLTRNNCLFSKKFSIGSAPLFEFNIVCKR